MKKNNRQGMRCLFRFSVIAGLSLAALFALAWILTIGNYSVPKTVADDASLPVIEAGGYRFHGETFGDPDAPPMLVVHGGPGWDYRSLLSLKGLADQYRVIFYDQRGSGLSPRVPAEQLSLESSLADLDALVEQFRHGGRVILIGHSWGAMLVAAYLGREPGKVSRAVLAEPGFFNDELFQRAGLRLGPRWEAGYLLFSAKRWFESLHIDKSDPQAPMDYFLGEVASRANPEYYCDGVIPKAGTLHWRAGATAMGAILGSAIDSTGKLHFDITDGLSRFSSPVLFLASSCNQLIGIDQQQLQANYFPSAEVVVIPDCGHMLFAEQPQTTLKALRRYLQDDGETDSNRKE